jgi:hypothetical protein
MSDRGTVVADPSGSGRSEEMFRDATEIEIRP